MNLRIPMPTWLAHHMLKISSPLALAALLCVGTRPHWALAVAGWTALLFAVVGVLISVAHAMGTCPRCKPRKNPARWYYRAWGAFGRHGLTPVFVAVLLSSLGATLLLPESQGSGLEPSRAVGASAIVLAFTAYLSALRFTTVNYPEAPVRMPIETFFQGRGKGLVHHADRIALALAVVAMIMSFMPREGGPMNTARLAVSFLLLFAVEANQRHGMTLCEECVKNFRVDAAEYAHARVWRLKAVHRLGPVAFFLILGVFIASFLVEGIAMAFIMFLMYAQFIALILLGRFHGAYQPWCPVCRNGGGGDDECEAHPTPTGGNGRPLPVS